MAEIVYMPKLSDTMTEGVVAAWNKKVGEEVKEGEILAEIETDKATMEFESFYDGVLLHIGVETGSAAPVNSVLAVIGAKDEDVAEILKNAVADDSESDASVPQEESKAETPVAPANPTPSATPSPTPVITEASNPTKAPSSYDKMFASPLAKKLARDKGIDLNTLQGSGDNGRIIKRDIDHYIPFTPAATTAQFSAAPAGTESYTDETLSQMRKTIARRLADSKFTAPHFYLTLDIDMDNAIAARKSMNAMEGVKVSFNDMVVKSVAHSLKKNPNVNSAWMGDFIRRNDHFHIGVAVAVEDGLLVPVVKFADTKGLMQISAEVKDFAQKAKDKKLQPSDWEGNTFTISNLGMFGIESFTAIVNPPDSCILAIGGIKQVPVVKDGAIVPGNVMKVTLSCDHRVVDGATGAAFLQDFKQFLENPVAMLL
jgi:pyruvate dehydrogenase E2 component (dihydrolipoamide acetyltransferase)